MKKKLFGSFTLDLILTWNVYLLVLQFISLTPPIHLTRWQWLAKKNIDTKIGNISEIDFPFIILLFFENKNA